MLLKNAFHRNRIFARRVNRLNVTKLYSKKKERALILIWVNAYKAMLLYRISGNPSSLGLGK
jgi:hypothetical protein